MGLTPAGDFSDIGLTGCDDGVLVSMVANPYLRSKNVRRLNTRRCDFAWPLVATLTVLVIPSHATESSWTQAAPIVVAQASPSIDKIRAQSQRMKEYRALLADPDSNLRLAALDEMLKSSDAAMRELAFEAGFASADQNMRALALRERVLSMKSFSLELQNAEKLPDEAWQKASAAHRNGLTFTVTKTDAQTGNLEIRNPYGPFTGRIAGQELSISGGQLIVRLRLVDGAVMSGTYSISGKPIAATLTLQ